MVSKTYFSLEVGGHRKKLLAAKEEKSRDVRLLLSHAENFENGDGTISPIHQQYYSLHPSPGSDVFTFKQTIELKDGNLIDSVHSTYAIESRLFCLLFASRAADLRLARYDAKIKVKDRDIRLGRFNPAANCILYAVLICQPGTEYECNRLTQNVTFADFSLFRIIVVWSYLHIPSLPSGDRCHNTTGFPRFNKVPAPKLEVTSAQGHTLSEAQTLADAMLESLRVATIGRAIELVGPSNREALISIADRLYRTPI